MVEGRELRGPVGVDAVGVVLDSGIGWPLGPKRWVRG